MNKTLKLLLFLGIVSAVSGLAIGAVNSVVAPVIEENDIKAEKKNLSAIFPESEFEQIEYENEKILTVYKAEDKGYVVKATTIGFNASEPIIILVGFDTEGNTVAVKPLRQQETDGFGSKCFEKANIESLYVGRDLDTEVDLLAGATFTSNAMREMITEAQNVIREIK
ncbi:MAG: FMN-binding protein [Erysipelotrichaceae bacterium]|nr:FMN-binding protein [Erysipelotrichaceae bacterium]